MNSNEHRRRNKRYPIRLKAAAVFDKADAKPILHTQTRDLSIGGGAIESHDPGLTGSTITLLIAQPPLQGEEAPRMLKVRAKVVSTIQTKSDPPYWHGLSFINGADHNIQALSQLLGEAALNQENAKPLDVKLPESPEMPRAPSRLEQIRQVAQAKQATESKEDPKEVAAKSVQEALQRAYKYLKELNEQLNLANVRFSGNGYSIVGVPEFSGFAWKQGQLHFRSREVTATVKVWDEVSLYYVMSGNKEVRILREYPASEKLKATLQDYKIEFRTEEKRNSRGSLENSTFIFPCDIKASIVFIQRTESGGLLLRMSNVERLGTMDYLISPEAINEASLEELTSFILGETKTVGSLVSTNP